MEKLACASYSWSRYPPAAAGQERIYSLRPERFRELDEWLARYRGLWEQRLDRMEVELEYRQHARKEQRR
jgi:hypothetical protein